MYFPLYHEGIYLGYIVYDQVNAFDTQKIFDTVRIYAPIVEVCLHLIEAKKNTKNIIAEMAHLLAEESNG